MAQRLAALRRATAPLAVTGALVMVALYAEYAAAPSPGCPSVNCNGQKPTAPARCLDPYTPCGGYSQQGCPPYDEQSHCAEATKGEYPKYIYKECSGAEHCPGNSCHTATGNPYPCVVKYPCTWNPDVQPAGQCISVQGFCSMSQTEAWKMNTCCGHFDVTCSQFTGTDGPMNQLP